MQFLTLIRPDGSAPAAIASLLFDTPGPQNNGHKQRFATFLPLRAFWTSFFLLCFLWLFFSLSFFVLTLSLSLPLSLFLLWLFSQLLRVCPQVGTLTSKFLSVTHGLSYCWITFMFLGEPKKTVYMHGFPKQTEMALLSFIIKVIVFTSVINICLYLHNYHMRSINFGLKRSPWQLEMMYFQAAALQNIPAWM